MFLHFRLFFRQRPLSDLEEHVGELPICAMRGQVLFRHFGFVD